MRGRRSNDIVRIANSIQGFARALIELFVNTEMLSALKKLTASNNTKPDAEINRSRSQTSRMSKTLQNKFSKGVQYNSELIIMMNIHVELDDGDVCINNFSNSYLQ